jgi:hypothetical protein
MATMYKKLNTPSKETLEDDFSDLNPKLLGEDNNNVGLKLVNVLKTPNGLKLKTTTTRDPNSNLVHTIEPELKIAKYNLLLEGKVGTDKKFQKTISLVDYLQKGSKFFVRGLTEKGKHTVEAGFEYKDERVALNGTVTKPLEGQIKVVGAGVVKQNSYSVGGDVEYEVEKGVSRYSAKTQIDKEDSTFCLFLNDQLVPKSGDKPKREVGFSYFFKLRGDLNGALDFKVDDKLEDNEFRVGSVLKVDSNTTIKSRMLLKNKKDFRLGLALKQKITPSTKVTLSTDLDAKSLFGSEEGGNKHRFNLTFSFGDD